MVNEQPPRKTDLWKTIGSVLAGFFGVQSNANRERDFTRGRAGTFIIVGLVMTVLFVLTLYLVVKAVIASATG
jgi:hypothetical protein